MFRKLFSHTAIYGIAPQIPKVAGFFTLPIITKDLTSLDYGVMGTISAYTAAIAVFATFGLRLILINSYYKSPLRYQWVWRQVYGFLMVWNLFYTAILSGLIYFIIPQEVVQHRPLILFLIIVPMVFFGPIAEIGSTYYQVRQKPWGIAIRSIIFGMLTIVLNIVFIVQLKLGFLGWFWSTFFVGIVANLSYFFPMYFRFRITPIFNFRINSIKKYLKITLPVIPHSYSTYLLDSSDRMVMSILNVDTRDIGKYNLSYLFGNIMQSLGMASGLAIGPLMNELYVRNDQKGARDLVFGLQASFFLLTFLICLWLKEVFHLMIKNEELSKMYPLAIIIIMGYNYRPMYFGANNGLFFAEKTHVLWRVTFIAGISNIVMNFIAIPIFGYEAAAYTTFVALMYMGYAGYYFRIFKEICSVNYYPIRWILSSLLLTVIAYFAVELAVILKAGISLGCLLLCSWLAFHFKKLLNQPLNGQTTGGH